MRPQFIKTAIAVLICSPIAGQSAWAQGWNGSYAADGQCYCSGTLPPSLSSIIVPTPIGGQAISQVCQRIGDGPELSRTSGLFNYPVYADAQCGNGPYLSEQTADPLCPGSLDGKLQGSAHCEGIGPKWNLRAAFARPGAPAAALRAADPDSSVLNKPLVSSSTVNAGTGNGTADDKPLKTTVIRSASTANRALDVDGKLGPFTGKKVTISGQRYLQARDGLSANGGEPGSRIILDDLVFLRDDGSINPANLYRAPIADNTGGSKSSDKSPEPVAQAAQPVANEKSQAEALAAQRQADAEATARLAAEKRKNQILAEMRAQQEAEDLETAKARLDEEARKKAEIRLQEIARLKRESIEVQRQREQAQSATGAAESSITAKGETASKPAEDAQVTTEARRQEEGEKQSLAARKKADAELAAREQRTQDEQSQAAQEAQKKQTESVAEAARQVKPASSKSGAAAAAEGAAESPFLSALRLPPEVRPSSRDFSYLEAMPVSYDVGGNGATVEASYSSHSRFQYTGRIGVTASYNELMVGAGYYLTPANADRLTVVLLAGIEYGSFELSDDRPQETTVDFDDSGLYLGAATRVVLNDRFELKAGVGYSSFFEGDAMLFGGGYYHINRQLDLVTRFEVGDNDLLGIGLRFYY